MWFILMLSQWRARKNRFRFDLVDIVCEERYTAYLDLRRSLYLSLARAIMQMKAAAIYSRLAGVHLRDGVEGDGHVPAFVPAGWILDTGGDCLKQREG